MEAHVHLVFRDDHIGRDIDEVAEEVARLGIRVAVHAPREQAVESAGDDQERHVEIHLEADRRGQCIPMEEAHRVRERVLNEPALCVARNQFGLGRLSVIREEDCWFLVAQIAEEQLAEHGAGQFHRLLEDLRRFVLASRHVEPHAAPGRGRQALDFCEETVGTPPERDERDAQAIETREIRVGGQSRIKHQVAGIRPVVLLPEGDEAEDLFDLFPLTQVGV